MTQREMLAGPYPLAITIVARFWTLGEAVEVVPVDKPDGLADLRTGDYTAGLRRQPERHWRRRRGY